MTSEPLGLSRMPAPWLAAFPSLLARLAAPFPDNRIPLFVVGLFAKHGILEVEFHQDQHLLPQEPAKSSLRTALRVALNRALYPSAWH